jgi:DNA-binding PadR family transcriptional regulator
VRRSKAKVLVTLEASILNIAVDLGVFFTAQMIRELEAGTGSLVGYGTLLKALTRLEQPMGFLHSEWEDADVALEAKRPRRRMYQITPTGQQALAEYARQAGRSTQPRVAWQGT